MDDAIEKDEIPEPSPQIPTAEDDMPGQIPEVGHAHGPHSHGSGIPWLDIVVGVSAMFISVVSLAVSIEHGRTMEKMVDQNQNLVVANTLPLLTLGDSIGDTSGKSTMRVLIYNGGVGPAVIDRFEVRYKHKLYTSEDDFLNACCAAELLKSKKDGHTRISYSNVSGNVLPAREEIDPITINPDKAGMDLFHTVFRLMHTDDVAFHACYCSVLDECWETDFDKKRPQPVKECKVAPGEKLW
jgi:hypothetical protein